MMLRRLCAGALALAALAAAAPARGQGEMLIDPSKKYASPRNFAIGLGFGPYRPNIDSEFNTDSTNQITTPPYQQYFGSGGSLMSRLEFNWEFFKDIGTAALGLSAGYFSVKGHSVVAATGTESGDETTFRMVPLSASLIYRLDIFADRWKVPLAPYVRGGFDYNIWWVTNGNGDIPTDPMGNKGRGGTWGWHVAGGMSLLLDILDPSAARQFDSETGVNHTWLFFEWAYYDISGLGQSGRLPVGDSTWLAGLMFEF